MANLLQLKIALRYTRPVVWRRVALPDTLTLWELHFVLQILFDWENYHLFEFRRENRERPELDFVSMTPSLSGQDVLLEEEQGQDPRQVLLSTVLTAPDERLTYTYDFGDYWQHDIVVELVTPLAPDAAPLSVRCLAGRRAAPPEDIGGPPGFDQLLEILAEKAAGKRKRMPAGYTGLGKFAPAEFDLARYNHNLTFLAEMVNDFNQQMAARGANRPPAV